MITREFLKGDYEYLLMIDADNPPLKNPLELIKFEKDVMVCPTLMFKGDVGKLAFNVFREVRIKGRKDWQTMVYDGVNKMFEVDRAGTGCVLIRRAVLKNIVAPFKTKMSKEGLRLVGEDMMFSDRVLKAGFEIWGHWDYCCSHYKTIDLLSVADIIIKVKTNEKDFRNTTPSIKIR
jgi:GT2 family glycosyltransferase